jgi:hypothetical protein
MNNQDRKPVGCYFCRCDFAEYRECYNGPNLFCHYADEVVFDLPGCPIGKWTRDKHGKVIPMDQTKQG